MVNNSSRLRQYERRFLKGEITCREKRKKPYGDTGFANLKAVDMSCSGLGGRRVLFRSEG